MFTQVNVRVSGDRGEVTSSAYLIGIDPDVKFAKMVAGAHYRVVAFSEPRVLRAWDRQYSESSCLCDSRLRARHKRRRSAKGDGCVNQVGTSVGPRPKRGSTPAESVDSTRLRRRAKLIMRTLITGSGGFTGSPMPDRLLTECHRSVGVADLNTGVGG